MFERYAIFYTPIGAFADWGAAWLGWDSAAGCSLPQPQITGFDVAALTLRPRKYGLHGTLKAPFRLKEGQSEAELCAAAKGFAQTHPAAQIDALALHHTHGFVALRPASDSASLRRLEADVVTAFDPFRAPLSEADIARRRKARLSPTQDAQLLRWGYPFVFDDFNFHLTLSGRMRPEDAAQLIAVLTPQLQGLLPAPYAIDAITLMGEDTSGMFHQIERYPLLA